MFPHFIEIVVIVLQFGFLALIVYAVLRGIRWAVAHGIHDAQKMAERERLAATPATSQTHDQPNADGTTIT